MKAKKEGRDGIDAWTSNGYGLTFSKPTPEQEEKVRKVNEELRDYINGKTKKEKE